VTTARTPAAVAPAHDTDSGDAYSRSVIIFGANSSLQLLAVVAFVCGRCHTHAAQRVIQRATKLSVFFIPILTLRRSYYVECTNCGRTTTIDRAQADGYVAFAADNPLEPERGTSSAARDSGPIELGHLDARPSRGDIRP
jgi:hypothetical protein